MSRRSRGRRRNGQYRTMDVVAPNPIAMTQATRETMYLKIIKMLAISRFHWTNLPVGIDERFVELTLFERGSLLFFLDERIGRFLVSQMNYAGNVNLYFNPTKFTPVGNNYSHPEMDSSQAVPVWDNFLRTTMVDVMRMYAKRLALMDRALDINIDNLSVPIILSCTEQQKNTVQSMLRMREDGMPIILTYSDLDMSDKMNVFANNTPYLVDKILHDKSSIWNECVRYLGIESSGTDKKERMVTDEAKAGSGSMNVFRLNYLQSRQQACDTINQLWPELKVGIEWADVTTGGIIQTDVDTYVPASLVAPTGNASLEGM